VSVDPKLTIRGIQELQRANQKMIHALKPEGARGRAVLYATRGAQRYATAITHKDTGALKASHRMKYDDKTATGNIYIDPRSINPRSFELPIEYGLYEHARGGEHAFYKRTVDEYGGELMMSEIKMIEEAIRDAAKS